MLQFQFQYFENRTKWINQFALFYEVGDQYDYFRYQVP